MQSFVCTSHKVRWGNVFVTPSFIALSLDGRFTPPRISVTHFEGGSMCPIVGLESFEERKVLVSVGNKIMIGLLSSP